MTERHPGVQDALKWFAYMHLPETLQAVSAPFHALAQHLVAHIPDCPQLTLALHKLLEAKDAAVRAELSRTDGAHMSNTAAGNVPVELGGTLYVGPSLPAGVAPPCPNCAVPAEQLVQGTWSDTSATLMCTKCGHQWSWKPDGTVS